MIPAILSCVFVIYLYQTLNHSDRVASPSSSVTSGQESTPESLLARIADLQRRVDEIAQESES